MPKGIPNTNPPSPRPAEKKIVIILNPADLAMLEKLATEQYRTPQLQASYLLSRVLAEAIRNQQAETMAARCSSAPLNVARSN